MSFLERCRIPPLVLFFFFALIMWRAGKDLPGLNFEAPGGSVPGAVLICLGFWFALPAIVSFVRKGTTVDPTKPSKAAALVSTGAYRFSRNPMYLGFVLMLAGLAIISGNWMSLLLPPVYAAYIDRFQIRAEEEALKAKFGAEFDEYARKVRRWL